MAVVPSPNTAIEQTRPDLAGSLEEFDVQMNMERMVGLQVFPVLEVSEQAGQFGRIPIEELIKSVRTERSSGGRYSRANFRFTKDTWATEEHGVGVPVDERNSNIYRDWFDVELVSARLARQLVMINYERRVAETVQDTSAFSDVSVTNGWANASAGRPIDDVEAAVQRLYDKGILANALVIQWKTFRSLRNNEQVIERVASSGAGDPSKPTDITLNMLRQVFDLPNIIVAGAQHNTANEGQSANLATIWDDDIAVVTRVTSTNAPVTDPCIGRTFHWGEDGSVIGGLLESYRDPDSRSDIVRQRMETDEKVMYEEAAELLTNVSDDGS